MHVGDVEELSVGCQLHVLRHAAARKLEGSDDALLPKVDLDQLPGELAAGDQVAAMCREVHVVDAPTRHGEGMDDAEGVRVAEVEPAKPLCDDDRKLAIGREVQVVGVGDGNGAAGPRRPRIDRRDRVALVVQHIERLQVPRGRDVLRQCADRELPDDLQAARVDDVDRVAVAVRDVDARECASRGAAEHVRTVRGIDVDGRRRAGACSTGESKYRRLRTVRAPTARDEDAGAERDCRCVRERLSQVTRCADPSGARVDRLDPGGRRVEARSASSDHVREPAQLGRGRVSGRPGQASEPAKHSARGRVLEDLRARLPVRQRPARDDELAARRRDGRVAHGRGQMGDDPRSPAGRPRDDGVEPVRSR